MKGCFILQRRFAFIGHSIAQILKETYGVTDFCGYVFLRDSYNFIRTQTDIPYTSLLFDEDIQRRYKDEKLDLNYLKQLEAKFGMPNLWPYLIVDRILMSNQLVREYPYDKSPYTHEELLRMAQVYARTIEEFLDRERPDFIFGSVFGSLGAFLLYNMAKARGIKVLAALPACTAGRYLISEKYDYFTGVEERFRALEQASSPNVAEATEFLQAFRAKPESYSRYISGYLQKTKRRSQLEFLLPKNIIRSAAWYRQVVRQYREQRQFADYSSDMNPWYYLEDRVKRKLRNTIGLSDLYDEMNTTEDFAFFPLHYEPEVALSMQAPLYTDQVNLIGHIARSLPVHFKLYVKEHPAMAPFRPRQYYRQIKKNPNVRLIDPSISGLHILPRAKLITAITSTVGWEGAMLKKPVITFGDQFYNALPVVKKCQALKDLPYLVKEQLEHFVPNEDQLLRFLQAVFDDSIPLDMTQVWEYEWDLTKKRAALQPLAYLLAKKLALA